MRKNAENNLKNALDTAEQLVEANKKISELEQELNIIDN
jgi:hypothetical protein